MKGVSTVIATILMLMITIGLAGVAASYMFGWLSGKTAVVLEIVDAECTSNGYTVWVRNDGEQKATSITVDVEGKSCTITELQSGQLDSCSYSGGALSAGFHTIRVTTRGTTVKGSLNCIEQ